MQRLVLVVLAGVLVVTALVVVAFWSPAQASLTATGIQSPAGIEANLPAAQATAAPTPKPVPPVAVLKIVPVAANPADPNVISYTVGPTTSIATGASGLDNVSVGVPVHVGASVTDAKNPAKKYAWTLTAPSTSKAALKDANAAVTEFTPDVAGWYKVDLVASNDGGNGPMDSVQIHADVYLGDDANNCKTCHPTKVAEWSETGHATKLEREIDGSTDPATSHYSESCIRCHTVGYNPGVSNGGFTEVQAKLGYKFPSTAQIQKGKGNWDAMPKELQAVSNIQCENCHGPASEHVKKGVPVMAASLDEGVCNVCHNGGGHHSRGDELSNSKHSDKTAMAWNYPTGPDHQDCVRCHSGAGYISFLANPKDKAAWVNEAQTPSCATCHDPHDDANPKQLRVVGKPVEVPFDNPKDAGLSATCEECHNGRQRPENAVKGSFPHYSSAAEFLNSTGGVDYGQKIVDSPHAMLVGAAAMSDPSDKTGQTKLFGGATPGPCVACHMYPSTDAKDPNYLKVGQHSFNTVSPDGKFDYTAPCQSCHGAVKDFNFAAKADYDGNGKVEGVQDEVKGLLNVLWKALEAKGVKKIETGNPYATLPTGADGKVDPKIANAWFNFRVVYGVMWGTNTGNGNQGAAQAVHNFKRAVSLLQLSYKDLTGQDVPSATAVK